jgi:hypothetical protein
MISEEEKIKIIESKKCTNCLEWHKHCDAECCKLIFLNIDMKDLEKPGKYILVKLKEKLDLGEIRYYQLRDIEYLRGFLRIKKERVSVVGTRILYIYPCKFLKNNLCIGHPDKKPRVCRVLTLENSKLENQPFTLTDNCLFKYKCMEVKENAKERKN